MVKWNRLVGNRALYFEETPDLKLYHCPALGWPVFRLDPAQKAVDTL